MWEWIDGGHPETPDEPLPVSNPETGDFPSWQGNRGVARGRMLVRRTGKHEMDTARAKKNHFRMETRYGQNGDE